MSILSAPADTGSTVLDPIAAKIANPFSTTVNQKGLKPQDFPGGFKIEEYQNGQPFLLNNQTTTIRLIGNMMPFQPFPWNAEQRLVRTYYPGNPEVAVQVLGPKEGDLIIKGRFKDKHYKDPSYYGAAYQFSLALNEMRKRGNLLRFGMVGQAGKWVRWGYLEHIDFKMNKLSWIDYELSFLVIGETKPVNNYFAGQEKDAPNSVNQDLITSIATFQSTYSTVPKTVPLSIAGLINGLISDVAKNINLVTGFVGSIIATAASIEASANRALGLIKHAQTSLYEFQQSIGALSNGFNSIVGKNGKGPQVATQAFQNAGYYTAINSSSNDMQVYLAKLRAQFRAIVQTIPLARYKTIQSDTLQNISTKYYGSADYASNIYKHNNLQTTVLSPGTVLEIPHL